MPYFQTLPDFEKNKKLLKLLMLFLMLFLIRNFTTDARFSIISDIGS